MTFQDLSSDAIADRVNCYAMGAWIDALAHNGGVALNVPLSGGRARVDVPIASLGIDVTLFRKADDTLSEADQVVFHRVSFDPLHAVLPFGLDGRSLTPASAKTPSVTTPPAAAVRTLRAATHASATSCPRMRGWCS
ncbi:protein of unknown function [Beijerinckiaceae bacterium RH AL1]|nr:hypothetical protein [Beijerinckiaceae bacterium]VVB43025.1 protein of unknown function [Beijerinckiaceae bacterium RH AL8]VVB43038.1 protein of unknown function [Beijerinckiaceae bacterium RH CH11]VVC53629.1 protein of unknown function [Beijerinckiaceae bacterium RH AL1]